MITSQPAKGGESKETTRNRERRARSVRRLVRNRERLHRRERLSAIGEMASTLVHEIRNPLTVIGGFARELEREGASNQEAAVPLKIIVNEVSRLESLVDNVLSFARTDRSRLRSSDLNQVLRESCGQLGALCARGGITVEMDLDDTIPAVLLDRNQFRQVLDNLCTNARQAMPHGGTVRVSTRRVDGEVEVRIADTGPGIPASLRAKVFEPFYSSSSTGTGLGLAVVSKIMAGHGGSIRLDPKARRGASFSLRFPIPRTASEA
jgi:signal transduction histidine kinase